MEGEQHPKATSANVAQVGLAMTLTEAMVEEAALDWFDELDYAVLPGLQLAPGEPTAERQSFSDVVLVGRLRQAIGRLNPTIPKEDRE